MARGSTFFLAFILAVGLTAAEVGAQTVEIPRRLHRNCTPAVWQADDVGWSGDVSPHNKIDDEIDAIASGVFDIIVNFRRCVTAADLHRLARLAPAGHVDFKSLYIPSVFMMRVAKREVAALAALPQVAFIERQRSFVTTLGVSSQAIQVSRGFYSFWVDDAGVRHFDETVEDLDPSLDGSGTGIAILDTGVDDPGGPGTSHVTFDKATRFFDGITEDEANPDDVAGHGTLVASIALGRCLTSMVAGVPGGIAPKADLIDVKVLENDGSIDDPKLVHQALEYLYRQRETGDWKVDVINMSFKIDSISSDGKDTFSQLVDLGSGMGIVMVTTAANDQKLGVPSPGAATRSITVAASDDRNTGDRRDDKLGTDPWNDFFSNHGPRKDDGDGDLLDELKPEVTAPGDEIFGALVDTKTGLVPASSSACIPSSDHVSCYGTSLAAPHVAGLAALIIQKSRLLGRPRINPASVKQMIVSSAERRGGPTHKDRDPQWNDHWGWGLINGFEAIRSMQDPKNATDLSFPNHGKGPSWLSPDITTLPAKIRPGMTTAVKVSIENASTTITAKEVWVVLGVHDYAASIPAFTAIGTLKLDLKPGVTEISFPWTPTSRNHQCLEVEIGYGPDTNFDNNKAQRNLEFAESPVIFQVQNTAFESSREIHFEATLDPPTNDWSVTITPPSVVLDGDDCPADIQVLLEPKAGVPPGARQRVHVAALIDNLVLGGVTVEKEIPAFPDCNANGIDDFEDVAGGASPDLNGNSVPDECEQSTVGWRFSGTAQGGSVSVTITGFSATCSVMVTTVAGQTATAVATNLAAAINGDACMQGQGITAKSSGGLLEVSGLGLNPESVSDAVTDPGLQHEAVPIPTLEVWGLLSLALTLAILGFYKLAGVPRSKNRKDVR